MNQTAKQIVDPLKPIGGTAAKTPPAKKTKATKPPSDTKPEDNLLESMRGITSRLNIFAERLNKQEENLRRLYERNHMQMQ